MKRVVLVVGSAGAGKSTFINAVSGTELAKVGHSILHDGTSDNLIVDDSSDPNLVFVDTPGIDSANYSQVVVEKVQKQLASARLLIILVINKQMPRLTSFLIEFEKIKADLIGNEDFVIVWSRQGDISQSDTDGLQRRFPKAHSFEFSSPSASIDEIRAFLMCNEWYSPLKAQVAIEKAMLAMQPVPKKTKKSTVPALQVKKKPFPLFLPPVLASMNGLKSGKGKKGAIEALIEEVIKLKKVGGTEYQELALMGDAFLKPQVLAILKATDQTDCMKEEMYKLIDNKPSSALFLFYEKYISQRHDKVLPSEKDSTPHSKADVVEALLELARRKCDSWACAFIVSELFRLVNNTRVITEIDA